MTEGHFNIKKALMLDNEERVKELRPYQLLKDVAGVVNGMTCVDLGCGTGTFTIPMNLCVGNEGVVYAVDDSAEMLAHIRAKNPTPNLILVNRDAEQTGLDDEIADFCLLAFILHEVKQPAHLIAEAFRLLKYGGKVSVVEWRAELTSPGPPKNIRLTKVQVQRLFKEFGFSDFQYIDWSNNHYVALGGKKRPR